MTIAVSFFTDLVGCHNQLVYWHVIGMGTAPEVHSIFLEGHTFLVRNHRQASLEISPITFLTVQTILTELGQFLLFCHISSHQHGNICGCPKQVEEKSRSNLPLMFVVGFAFGRLSEVFRGPYGVLRITPPWPHTRQVPYPCTILPELNYDGFMHTVWHGMVLSHSDSFQS